MKSKGCRDVCLVMKKSTILVHNVHKLGGNTEW